MNAEVIVIDSDSDSDYIFPNWKPRNSTRNRPPRKEPKNVRRKVTKTPQLNLKNRTQRDHFKVTSEQVISPFRESIFSARSAPSSIQGRDAQRYLDLLDNRQDIYRSVVQKRREMDNLVEKEDKARRNSELASSKAQELNIELNRSEEQIQFHRLSLANESSSACIGHGVVKMSKKLAKLKEKRVMLKTLQLKRDRQRFLALENSKQATRFEESKRKCKKQLTSLLILLNAARSLEDDEVGCDGVDTSQTKQQSTLEDTHIRSQNKPKTRKGFPETFVEEDVQHCVDGSALHYVEEDVIDYGNGAALLDRVRKPARLQSSSNFQRQIRKPRTRKYFDSNSERKYQKTTAARNYISPKDGLYIGFEEFTLPAENPYRVALGKLGLVMVSVKFRNQVPRVDKRTAFFRDLRQFNAENGRHDVVRRTLDLFYLISLVLRLGGIKTAILIRAIPYLRQKMKVSVNYRIKHNYVRDLLLYEHKLVHGKKLSDHDLNSVRTLKP